MGDRRIVLTLPGILLLTAVVGVLLVGWQLRGLLLIVMCAIVVAASIEPLVDTLERWRLPRWLGVLFTLVLLVSLLVGTGASVGPLVVGQIALLLDQLPNLIAQLQPLVLEWSDRLNLPAPEFLTGLVNPEDVVTWLLGTGRNLLQQSYGLTRSLVGALFSVILGLLLSAYMVVDSRALARGVVNLFPAPWDQRLMGLTGPVGDRMGGYIRGRILVSLILAVLTALGLKAVGLGDYAIGLGAIAGFTNLIPFLGPILGAVPALLVALAQDGWVALWVLLLFVIIQNLETYVLDPLLVGNAVGVHPLYQLLAVLGGAQLLGIIGAVIVPPWVAGGALLLEQLYLVPKAQRSSIGPPADNGPIGR